MKLKLILLNVLILNCILYSCGRSEAKQKAQAESNQETLAAKTKTLEIEKPQLTFVAVSDMQENSENYLGSHVKFQLAPKNSLE